MKRSLVLKGDRVALAEMTEADQPSFQQWLSTNAGLRELIDDHRVPTMQDQMNWFTRVQQPDRKFFALLTLPEQTLIGNCGFVEIDPATQSAILRITIGHPEFLGKGLGSEAVLLLVRYAFDVARWKQVTLKVLKTNPRAIRTYEKAGFKQVGEGLQNGKPIITMAIMYSSR